MDLDFSEEDRAFQAEVRTFLDENLTDELRAATAKTTTVFVDKDPALAWQRILHEKGWVGYFWPEKYGGTGWSPTRRFIFEAECARAGAPGLIPLGLKYVGPVIFTFGTDAQKDYFLPRILSGEDYWCQGYSEPGAGSDLAAVQCKAVRDGDEYVVNGTKIWTTHAHFANWIFCLVRTGQTEKPQTGISFLLIPMDAPGVKVEPIITLARDHELNQVFFDDVRVPATNLVGEEGKGWQYAKFLLEFERGGGSASVRLGEELAHAWRLAALFPADGGGTMADDPRVADALTQIEVEIMALEMTELRIASALGAGANPGAKASMLKTVATEIEQRLSEVAIDILGPEGLPFAPERPLYGPTNREPVQDPEAEAVMAQYLNKRAATIYGGTNEIQRDIIARMVLGLG